MSQSLEQAPTFDELASTRDMLDRRYEEIQSGKVKLIPGEAFFESLPQREVGLLKSRTS